MGFRVTPDELHDLGTAYSQHADTLDQVNSGLQARASGIEAAWTGPAAEQHHQLMQQYNTQLAQLKDTLHQISQNVHTSADNYAQADQAAQKGFTA